MIVVVVPAAGRPGRSWRGGPASASDDDDDEVLDEDQ
jgi:hypothetical protein